MQILGVIGSSTFPGIPDSDFFSIATATVTDTSTSTVTISNIPTGYKHLHLRWMASNSNAANDANVTIRFNGDSGSNYSWRHTYGTGVSPNTSNNFGQSGSSVTSMSLARATGNANNTIFGFGVADILDYSSTSKNKNITSVYGNSRDTTTAQSDQYTFVGGGSWGSTAAITSISFTNASTNFGINSKFAIYGYK